MEAKEAADVIEAMAESLRKNPGQFQFNINVKSMGTANISYGGTAQHVSVVGGGPGSHTMGVKSIATTGNISAEVAQGHANAEVQAKMTELVAALQSAANELRAPTPNPGTLRAIRDGLKEWVPSLIVNVLGTVIAGYVPKL